MLWLHPFTKAAGTVPLLCSHALGAAALGQQGGQGSGAGRYWGDLGREGRDSGQWALWQLRGGSMAEGGTVTGHFCSPPPAGIPRALFPSPRSGKAAITGLQLGWVSGLYVKGSTQL